MEDKFAIIKRQGIIASRDDMMGLDFIDWRRSIRGPYYAIDGVYGWLKNNITFTIVDINTKDVPERADFPVWEHAGNHVLAGRNYWQWFHYQFEGITNKSLVFDDSPDFSGYIVFPSHTVNFWGDIGKVAPTAFLESLMKMRSGDLWVTVYDNWSQLIIECQADFVAMWDEARMGRYHG